VRSSAWAVRNLANAVRFVARATRGSVLGVSLILAFSFTNADDPSWFRDFVPDIHVTLCRLWEY
jgi:hypothetical protein